MEYLDEIFAPAEDDEEFQDKMRRATEAMAKQCADMCGKHVTMIVLADATASMQDYIRKTNGGVMSLFRALTGDLGCTVTVGVVAYRDPVDKVDEDVHVVLPLTSSKTTFHRFMSSLKARGGGDEAEDWAGGMALVNEMIRTASPSTVLLCHVADAAAHGFCRGEDNHANDVERERLRHEMRTLRDTVPDDFEYLLFPVGSRSDSMVADFERMVTEECGADWVHSKMRTCKGERFEISFTSNVFDSVVRPPPGGAAARHDVLALLGLNEGAVTTSPLALLRVQTRDVTTPADLKQFAKDLQQYASPTDIRASFHSSFLGFTKHLVPPPTTEGVVYSTDTVVTVEPTAFAHGAERHAFRAQRWTNVPKETQDELCTDAAGLDTFKSGEELIFKVARVPRPPGFTESKMAVHVAAMGMAALFNSLRDRLTATLSPIKVVAPIVLSFPGDTTRMKKPTQSAFVQTKRLQDEAFLVERRLPDGDFVKIVDNAGRRNSGLLAYDARYRTADAWILVCAACTRMAYVPSDLQGVLTADGTLHLTDLAATCGNPLAFQESGTNLGDTALRTLVKGAFESFQTHPAHAELFGDRGIFKDAYAYFEAQTKHVHLVSRKRPRA